VTRGKKKFRSRRANALASPRLERSSSTWRRTRFSRSSRRR
jgi:hypothetical protein